MVIEINNPYSVLPLAGYTMCGTSNAFRRHTKPNEWFHAYVSHDEQTIAIHQDKSKRMPGESWDRDGIDFIYKKHKSFHRSNYIEKEIAHIQMIAVEYWYENHYSFGETHVNPAPLSPARENEVYEEGSERAQGTVSVGGEKTVERETSLWDTLCHYCSLLWR